MRCYSTASVINQVEIILTDCQASSIFRWFSQHTTNGTQLIGIVVFSVRVRSEVHKTRFLVLKSQQQQQQRNETPRVVFILHAADSLYGQHWWSPAYPRNERITLDNYPIDTWYSNRIHVRGGMCTMSAANMNKSTENIRISNTLRPRYRRIPCANYILIRILFDESVCSCVFVCMEWLLVVITIKHGTPMKTVDR